MDMSSAYIVTGTTRGIGKALAEEIAARGHLLFTISRDPEMKAARRHDYQCDLRSPVQIQAVMNRLMQAIPFSSCNEVVLINNAGVLTPIGALDTFTQEQVAAHMSVNLLAPIHIMAMFMQGVALFRRRRCILNITSGAARHPYAGWSLYCAAKAALNMITRCAALEHKGRKDGVMICAIAPGVVDTDMQAEIRKVSEEDFPYRSRFIEMKDEGRMFAPQQVARLILDLDETRRFDTGGLYDLRDVIWNEGQPTIAARNEKD